MCMLLKRVVYPFSRLLEDVTLHLGAASVDGVVTLRHRLLSVNNIT